LAQLSGKSVGKTRLSTNFDFWKALVPYNQNFLCLFQWENYDIFESTSI
jgi:hypothetical protein